MVTFAILMDQNKKIKKAVYTGYLIHRSFLKVKKDLVKKKGGVRRVQKRNFCIMSINLIFIYICIKGTIASNTPRSFIFGIFTMMEDKIK